MILGSAESEHPVKSSSKYSKLCDHDTSTSRIDGRTERRCRSNNALCVALRGKNSLQFTARPNMCEMETVTITTPLSEGGAMSRIIYRLALVHHRTKFSSSAVNGLSVRIRCIVKKWLFKLRGWG